jgi:hypothetical protein
MKKEAQITDAQTIEADDLSEYLRAKEPAKAELAGIWRAAIGLQKVDGLTPSPLAAEKARAIAASLLAAGLGGCALFNAQAPKDFQEKGTATMKTAAFAGILAMTASFATQSLALPATL